MPEEREPREERRIFAKPPRRLSEMTSAEIQQWARQLYDRLKESADAPAGAEDTPQPEA